MKWNLDALKEHFGDVTFFVGGFAESLHEMTLQNFVEYAKEQRDEDPLYLFEPEIETKTPAVIEDYTLPPFFADDLMSLLSLSLRATY